MPVNQLPKTDDPNFRVALKEARLAASLSYSALARRVGIHEVMPSRYENAGHSNATLPTHETWEKLNEVLFEGAHAPIDEAPVAADKADPALLRNADIVEIVAELKRRGATSVSIVW